MDKTDIIDILVKRTQTLRRSISGEPSMATHAAWRLEDARHEQLRGIYASQEADDDEFTFNFTSEVKRK